MPFGNRKRKLKKDPTTQKYIGGRRIDNPRDRIRELTIDKGKERAEKKRAQKAADRMQAHIDAMPEGPKKARAERDLQRHKDQWGI